MAQHGHSEACCTVPPARADYKEKGTFIEVNGLKTYKTGPETATTAILIIYDVFGFSPQGLQGADILAHADDEHHQYQVFIPDFLQGSYASHTWIPPDTPEKQAALGEYFQKVAAPPKHAHTIAPTVKALTSLSNDTITKWGALGQCWGGKVVSLTSGKDTVFSVVAEVHPAMVDPKEAAEITVPIAMLASKDEPAKDVQAFEKALTVPHHVETFADQVHGWMAARGDLSNERVRKEYERGYQVLLDFYHKHL